MIKLCEVTKIASLNIELEVHDVLLIGFLGLRRPEISFKIQDCLTRDNFNFIKLSPNRKREHRYFEFF